MPRGVIIPHVKVLTDHYLRYQRDGNIVGYRGTRMQHGYGIGGIFKSLARYAILILKKTAKAVGRRALKAGAQVAQDVADGGECRGISKNTWKAGRQRFHGWSWA